MNPYQNKVQSMASEQDRQKARYRPDEEPVEEGKPNKRLRGSRIKLSSRGDKKQHKRGSRRR